MAFRSGLSVVGVPGTLRTFTAKAEAIVLDIGWIETYVLRPFILEVQAISPFDVNVSSERPFIVEVDHVR